jgi:FtsZ-binding cell division protein ZapB
MKCDELKPLVFSLNDLAYVNETAVEKNFENPHDHAVYKATEVDALLAKKDMEITELKEENERLKKQSSCTFSDDCLRVRQLKSKLEDVQASAYAEMVDAGMRERRLRMALWFARAWFCGRSSEYFSGMASRCKIGQEDFYREVSERARRYNKSSYKCRAKAEEYK